MRGHLNGIPDSTVEKVLKESEPKLFVSAHCNPGTTAAYGAGVYCAPNIKTCSPTYAKPVTVTSKDGKVLKYRLAFQCRVNPTQTFRVNKSDNKTQGVNIVPFGGKSPYDVKVADEDRREYWIVRDQKTIRPYGILIKEEKN